MSYLRALVFSLLLLGNALLSSAVYGDVPVVEEPDLGRFFEARAVQGCFAVFDPSAGALRVYNPVRAERRFVPASTFKIANALIGLEVEAVSDVDEVLPYGGTDEIFDAWERDMSLRQAMAASNVAVFHQLAKRIGLERMKQKVRRFEYGNADVGDDIERRFWLTGPLAISAIEQVEFVRRVATNELNVAAGSLDGLKSIIEYSSVPGCRIFAKSGWAGSELEIGWWVGWLEKGDHLYPFAMNADIANMAAAKHRIPIALDCLAALGMIDQEGGQ